MDWGMANRMSQLIQPDGHCVFMPIDHGYFLGPTSKLEQPGKTVEPLLPYADALFVTRGVLRSAIDPANTKPLKELFSQRLSRCRRQGVDVLVIRYTQFVGKEASNLLFGFVQCRGDQVEGSFFRQLDDVFAQVGFVDVDPLGL